VQCFRLAATLEQDRGSPMAAFTPPRAMPGGDLRAHPRWVNNRLRDRISNRNRTSRYRR
jgi:hypothetical protein